ncbi:hypothetical protein IW261DRAFT_1416410 [Armillaria novae-zelandiae]|uniref:Uncharacterized protein n=1 Tax=Armillaria novae-zelandiae TaxID=153914 RepID=A0AA39PI21_9AGAR|nr:hypothetical protein IW261DRAFT_1416410 [Armillaria novae-zelandiae]
MEWCKEGHERSAMTTENFNFYLFWVVGIDRETCVADGHCKADYDLFFGGFIAIAAQLGTTLLFSPVFKLQNETLPDPTALCTRSRHSQRFSVQGPWCKWICFRNADGEKKNDIK